MAGRILTLSINSPTKQCLIIYFSGGEKRPPETRLRSQVIIVAENISFSFTNTRLEKAYSGYIKGCNSPRRWIFYVR